MTVGTSLKQLFQLCSGKYLKSEPSKFKAVNKVCLCCSRQADLTEKRGVGGGEPEHHGGSRAEAPRKPAAPSLLPGLCGGGDGGGEQKLPVPSTSLPKSRLHPPRLRPERQRAACVDSSQPPKGVLASVFSIISNWSR